MSGTRATGDLGTRLRAAWPRYRRPVRDALILVGLLRAFVFFFVQGEQPWTFWGVDARAYWRVDLADPYAQSAVGEVSTYLYSPVFAQIVSPLSILPFEVFFLAWFAASLAACLWLVRPWPWAVPMLILPIIYELCVGNIHFFLAVAFALSLRAPSAWALPLLTKITPAVGGLWHLVRGEWRAAGIAAATVVMLVGLSVLTVPSAWSAWFSFLLGEQGQSQLLLPRLALAALLVAWGARTNRPWVLAVAGWLALPVIWINAWVILLAAIRLQAPAPRQTGTLRA